MDDARRILDGKSILITGGTGSFGRYFTRKVLTEASPSKVIIFSRDEWKQWEMRRLDPLFDDARMRYFLGDVRDKDRLRRALSDVDYVVHAAALKQVPVAEYNPSEFVNTNVFGAMNVMDAAIDCGVQRVIALSTDKAVNPVNLYGATKLCQDKLMVSGNVYVGASDHPRFSIVRYGNVIGSRGSVIPFWKRLVLEGAREIPVTDDRMTRFWITLDQAVNFVIHCFEWMEGGEIFVPKIPSMRIVDLAEAIAPGIPLKICGVREGEKLHELMIPAEDSSTTLEFDGHYTIVPRVIRHGHGRPLREVIENKGSGGKALEPGFVYASDSNGEWLGVEALRRALADSVCSQEVSSTLP